MKTGWILCDKGKTGTYRQCLALANLFEKELGFQFVHKPISLNLFWRYLPPHFAKWKKAPFIIPSDLHPPYPDLIIAAGRQAVTMAMALRHYAFTIVLQHPKINPSNFDLVIPPYHDNLKGKNVLPTLGALHPIKAEELIAIRQKIEGEGTYSSLSFPRIAVLVGGDNKYYRYTDQFVKTFSDTLRYMVTQSKKYKGGSFLITPSRRTRPEIISELEKGLNGLSYQLWKGEGPNPYMDYLAISDAIVVTGDSISMMSESCLMGKPVYIAEMPIENRKFRDFIKNLYAGGHAVSFMNQSFASLDRHASLAMTESTRHCEDPLRILGRRGNPDVLDLTPIQLFKPLDELNRVGKQVVELFKSHDA